MVEREHPHNYYDLNFKAGIVNFIAQGAASPDAKDRMNDLVNSPLSMRRQRSGDVGGSAVMRGRFGSPALEQTDWVELTNDIYVCTTSPVRPGSRVYRGRQKYFGGKYNDVIVKILGISPKTEQEVALLLDLNHPNIVRIIRTGDYPAKIPEKFIVMETCLMDIQEYTERNKGQDLPFQKLFSYSKQLTKGVNYIHQKNIVHRDLKPTNILISKCENYIKISDFGISKVVPESADATVVTDINAGTEGFKAPEIYQGVAEYSYQADIFSLGICIYYIFTNGEHPFGSRIDRRICNIMNNINRDLTQIPTFQPPNTSRRQTLQQLIESTLQHEPASRPTASHILKHEFFSEAKDKVCTKRFSYAEPSSLKPDDEIAKIEALAKRSSYAEPSSHKPDEETAKIEVFTKKFSRADTSWLKPDNEKEVEVLTKKISSVDSSPSKRGKGKAKVKVVAKILSSAASSSSKLDKESKLTQGNCCVKCSSFAAGFKIKKI